MNGEMGKYVMKSFLIGNQVNEKSYLMGLEWLCLLFHGLVGPKEKKLMIASFLVLFLFIVFAQHLAV